MSLGLIITKPGVSVNGANDIEDLILSTDYPLLKVKSEGEDSVVFGSSDTVKTYDITHNLGYKAVTWVFADTAPSSGYRRRTNSLGLVDVLYEDNKTIINFYDYNTGSSRTYGFYYYVFYDPMESV